MESRGEIKQKKKELWEAFCNNEISREKYGLALKELRKGYWTKFRVVMVSIYVIAFSVAGLYVYHENSVENEQIAEENLKAQREKEELAKIERAKFEVWRQNRHVQEIKFIKSHIENKDYSFISKAISECRFKSGQEVGDRYKTYSIVDEYSANSIQDHSEMSTGRRILSEDEKVSQFLALKDNPDVSVSNINGSLQWLVMDYGKRKYINTYCLYEFDPDKKEILVKTSVF